MGTAGDVASDVVGVARLQRGRTVDAFGENAVAKPGGEAFDLRFDPVGHVDGRAVRDVAVRPPGVLAVGCARRVEQALLGQQHERAIGMIPGGHGTLARSDLGHRATEVDGAGPQTFLRGPWDWTVQGVVDLECCWSVSVAGELAPVAVGQATPRDLDELMRGHIEEEVRIRRQLIDRFDV